MTTSTTSSPTLAPTERQHLHASWQAANSRSVGQIYLLANPLLKGPLKLAHVKPRLLGNRGTTPGLNFVGMHRLQQNRIAPHGPGEAAHWPTVWAPTLNKAGQS